MPHISVLIPVYNVEKYLGACLDSVLKQTFQDFEVICINDGSTDHSLDVLNQYAQKDNRIHIISQKNQGVSVARNRGISNARGEYITFLDSDDMIAPTFLEALITALEKNPSAQFAWCDFKEEIPSTFSKIEIPSLITIKNPFDYFILRKKPRIGASSCAKLYKKQALNNLEFPKGLTVGEDLIFLYTLLLQSKVAVYVPEVLYFYRIRENSAMHKPLTQKRLDDEIEVTKRLFLLMQENELNKTTKKVFKNYIANRFFRCVFKMTKKEKDYSNWVKLYLPQLKELSKQKIFNPQNLSLKNKIKYFYTILMSNKKLKQIKC